MHRKSFGAARFLLVDDEPANTRLLEQILEANQYDHVASTSDPREVLSLYSSFSPDLILLDLMMPGMDGIEVMEQLRAVIPEETYLPIIVLTADITEEAKRRVLAAGAKDFLTKPFDTTELLLRIHNLLVARYLHLQLRGQNQDLERKVSERTHELEAANDKILKHMQDVQESQIEVLERLARAAEFRDDDTGQHTQRVGLAAALLAQKLGLSNDQVSLIQRAAPLHDVGKIGISDLILLKPGKLTEDEFQVMKSHATVGAALLAGGRSDLVQMAERIAHTHHERWDGSGYPRQLAADDIPIEGRILAIADVFDALTHDRPYKAAWPMEKALDEIKGQSGRHFDPQIVQSFLTLPHEILI